MRVPYKDYKKLIYRDRYLIIMVVFPLLYLFIFKYLPMFGNIIAFQDFGPLSSFWDNKWVGFKWFMEFFDSYYFNRLIRNTFLLSLYNLLWSTPVPILFAIFVNELKGNKFKRFTQTTSYLPYFISLTITVGIMADLIGYNGVISKSLNDLFGMPLKNYMRDAGLFRSLYISSNIWQSFGYNSIIYLAAITAIDQELYEAASADGARRFQKIIHITLPGILPTIITLLILNCGRMFAVGAEKVILMYSPDVYETADVIASYVYRRGILSNDFSFASAVGLFESAINVILLMTVNTISGKLSDTALW